MKMTFEIVEIEIGPHFLTFYGGPRTEFLQFSRSLRPLFDEIRPELAKIQQKDFAHQPKDPRVYHPYGHPIEYERPGRILKERSTHFHIRYGYRPVMDDITQAIELINSLDGQNKFKNGFRITNLEDQKAFDWNYPEIPENHEEYLKLLDDIRANKYDSIVE